MAEESIRSVGVTALTSESQWEAMYDKLNEISKAWATRVNYISIHTADLDAVEDEEDQPLANEYADENTLRKVDAAIRDALTKVQGNLDIDTRNIIGSLQNYGILFRERR